MKKIWLSFIALLVLGGQIPVAQAEQETPIKLSVGAFAAPKTPWDLDWQTFRKNLENIQVPDTDQNKFQVKLLIRGETGGEPITMTNIRRNRIQFGGFTIGGSSAVIPELSVLMSPFFFKDIKELDYVMDQHMLAVFKPLFAAKGLELIRWVDVGWLHMYGRKPILTPDDMKGYRARSQASEASQVLMESLDSDIHQMPFQDLIPALQTGLVKSGETNVVLYSLTGLAGEAPYLTMTHHAYDTGIIVANKKWFDSLDPESQQEVHNAFPSSDGARAGVRGMTAKLFKGLQSTPDVNIHFPTEAELEKWRTATADNHKAIIKSAGGQSQAVYDAMLAGRAEYRQRQKASQEEGQP